MNRAEGSYSRRKIMPILTLIAVSLFFLACNVTAQAFQKQGKVIPGNTPPPIEEWVRMPNTPTPSLENNY